MGKLRRKGAPRHQKNFQFPLSREDRIIALQQGLTGLSFELGRMMAVQLLEENVAELCGEEYTRLPGKTARRHGRQAGTVTLAGQKVAIERPRARLIGGGEAELGMYQVLQSPEAMPQGVMNKLLRGVSCRNYEGVVEEVRDGFGKRRSSVSRHFVKATAKQIRELAERSLEDERFVAIFIDGVNYGGEMLIAAMGVTAKGNKRILGLRQGATENAVVCKDLLADLQRRGLDTAQPVFVALDGSKALRAAVKAVWGKLAVVQRCQQHKIRNVQGYLADKYHDFVRERMSAAYGQRDWKKALKLLKDLAVYVGRINPDAASSLREGMEETLTVVRLGIPPLLAKSLATTNPIESAFSTTADLTRRVKRWRDGDMRLRWATAGLLRAESKFRRLRGFREIPQLINALESETSGKNQVQATAA